MKRTKIIVLKRGKSVANMISIVETRDFLTLVLIQHHHGIDVGNV